MRTDIPKTRRTRFASPSTLQLVSRIFDDYWQLFLGGQGPAPTYLASLDRARRELVRDLLASMLPVNDDGPIELAAMNTRLTGDWFFDPRRQHGKDNI